MPLLVELRSLGIELKADKCDALIFNFWVRLTLIDKYSNDASLGFSDNEVKRRGAKGRDD